MSAAAPDAMIDASLDYAADSDLLTMCTSEPTTYALATNLVGGAPAGYVLAQVALTPGDGNGDFVIADDTSGRKLTIGAQPTIEILATGTALHVALTKSGDTTLRYVTTCTSQALTDGGTVDIPAWKINIVDPTTS
jgi:hypothetical protein